MADLIITATSVVNSTAPTERGIAGEAITAGQVVYLKSTDDKLWKAQCDGTAEEGAPVGIALNGGAVGQTVAYAKSGGRVTIGATTVKTTTYCLSAAAGGICPQADLVGTNKVVRIGHAIDTAGLLVVDISATGATV